MTPEPHPLVGVLARFVADTNRRWDAGLIAEGSAVQDVEPDLEAMQHAPYHGDGEWRADPGAAWLEGTAQATAALHGQGCSWSRHLFVLPRGEDEARFLETRRRGADGTWRLARHTAEKPERTPALRVTRWSGVRAPAPHSNRSLGPVTAAGRPDRPGRLG